MLILGLIGGLYYWFMIKGRDAQSLATKAAKLEVAKRKLAASEVAGIADWYLNKADLSSAINPEGGTPIVTKPFKDLTMSERSKLYLELDKLKF